MTKEDQQDNTEEDKKNPPPGFLPPQSLPTPPPPPPIPEQDSSDLLSPWWSEEKETPPDNTTTPPSNNTPSNDDDSHIINIQALGFGRVSKVEGDWTENCFMVATITQSQMEEEDNEDFEATVKRLTLESKKCAMVCFLRESKRFTQERMADKPSILSQLNPLFGTWVSVAKTPEKCNEHLQTEYLTKKTEKDYYSLELGDELSHSGDHVKAAFATTFGPLQRLGLRYIDSWKNGTQQAFFSRFYESAKRGDGIHLVTYSTKRLFESAIGHDKKGGKD
ncbi:hypothetical protein K501DRAFT_174801 [Backusella circina FSU 941]|nr:hypothetical protein K501DRAFT_174801 [Backusella circina FSU 941]